MLDRPSEPDWLYYRIYLNDLDDFDTVLETVVRPGIAAWRAELPDLRWFFLRFVDPLGPHVRLRFAADPSCVALMERDWDDRLDGIIPAPRRVGKYVYAPEYRKFGDVMGMRLAERIFQLSSETVMACTGERLRDLRTAYGAAHLALLVATLPAEQRLGFLHQYAWYWTGGPRRTGSSVDPAQAPDALADAGARVVAAARRVLADSSTREQFLTYRAAYSAESRGSGRIAVPRSDRFLLFHHIHLMHNRMGVYPLVEARLARLLWAAELTTRALSGFALGVLT
jgi:thiopeptide-type bacteriocin biosynthesis protein